MILHELFWNSSWAHILIISSWAHTLIISSWAHILINSSVLTNAPSYKTWNKSHMYNTVVVLEEAETG